MSKKKFIDPHAEREAQKYEKPIPSRELIMEYLQECGKLLKREQLIEALGLTEPEQQEALKRRLRAMERDGQLVFTRRGGYGLAGKMDLVRGRISGHKEGYGFLIPDDKSADLFLSAREMRAVFDGDKVLARVTGIDKRGRREGAIAEILERNTCTLVGRFWQDGGIAFVSPENKRIVQDIVIAHDAENGAQPGQMVMVEITTQPTVRTQAIGRVIEILGEHMAPGMEIDVAIRSYNIPHSWSDEVIAEIANLQEEVADQDKAGRVDLRDLALVTIDGEDARDFDDAVYVEPRPRGGWRLVVAIADVSHYVKVNSALDGAAYERGNSVYFPNEVVPMLPEILSNGLCSLKPNVDRLCMVCDMTISKSGKLTAYRFYEAVMHSQARLTYTLVAKLLENPLRDVKYEPLLPHIQNLHTLYQALRVSRAARGAIDFETTETRVIFGENRKIEQIVPVQRNVAHRIIEECMLMANVSAARFLLKQALPTLFRVHNGPTVEKLQDLRAFLAEIGLRLPGGKVPEPRDYGALIKEIISRPDARLIQTVLLRSLSQAVYSPENLGHFGLAFDAYTHFTSPIRRYPDLLVHRAIRYALSQNKKQTFYYDHAAMVQIGEHCSITERRADEATRDVLDWLKCEFMLDKVGQEFDGIITNVTGFGLFVELRSIYVEGLVHVTALKNDYYHFDPKKHRLQGERTGTLYRLGDAIKVRVARVNLDNRQLDFELIEAAIKQPPKNGTKKKVNKEKSTKKVKKIVVKEQKKRRNR